MTISPSISGTSILKKDDKIIIPKSSKTYYFKVGSSTIASVWNHSDVDKVEVSGGNKAAGTDPFTVTVNLKVE